MINFIFILIATIISHGFHQVSCHQSIDDNNIEQDANITGLLFKDFSWSQCGSTDVIKLSRLQVDPDPMTIPGPVSFGLDVLVKNNLTSPLPFTVQVKKKMFGVWIDIPCEHGFGSCQYPDFCTFWPYPKPCPEVFSKYGIPCSCPFTAKRYNFPEVMVGNATFPGEDIPKWLENGHYSIETNVVNDKGDQLFCIQILMQLKKAN